MAGLVLYGIYYCTFFRHGYVVFCENIQKYLHLVTAAGSGHRKCVSHTHNFHGKGKNFDHSESLPPVGQSFKSHRFSWQLLHKQSECPLGHGHLMLEDHMFHGSVAVLMRARKALASSIYHSV